MAKFCFYSGGLKKSLAVALIIFFGVTFSTAAFAQVTTTYTANNGNSVVGTFTSSRTSHSNPGPIAVGANNYSFTSVKMTISTTGSYTFGQTSAPVDTVMIVYNGAFDPLQPLLNKLVFNDDGGNTSYSCGGARLCPSETLTLNAGQEVTIVISTYRSNAAFTLPQVFQANGPALVGLASITAPTAPTSLSATPGNTQVAVAFTPPSSTGGAAVTNYEYTLDSGSSWTAFSPAVTASPATMTGLTNGTSYTVGLRAVNSAGPGAVSANVTSTPLTTPNAPTGLSLTPGDTEVEVAFTLPSSNGGSVITNYEYTKDGGTSWTAFGPAVTTSPVMISGLTNGTTYTIGLRAANSAGTGAAATTVTVLPAATPNAPTSLSATPGNAEAVVAFTVPSNTGSHAIDNYKYTTDGGSSWVAFSPAKTSSPVTISGLTNGTTYTIGLRAINSAGDGLVSVNVTTTPVTTPNAPTSLSATPGDTQVIVAFTPSSNTGGSAITNYEYTRDGGTSWNAFSSAVTTSPVTITGLTNGTTYTIGLRAVNGVGTGAVSATLTAIPVTTPNAPTGLSVTPGNTQVVVAFTPSSSTGGSAINNYEYTTDGGASWTVFSPAVTASPATITGLANGTTYTIGLRAVNSVGTGTASPTLTAIPVTTPNAPTGLSATPSDTQVSIAFTPSSSNGGSSITNYEYTTDGGASWTAFSSAVTTSPVMISSLTNGTTYTIGLRAVNAVGTGTASPTLTAIPVTTPNAATGLSATPANSQVTLAFTPPASDGGSAITNYEYTIDGGTSFTAFSPDVTTSPVIISGLTNGTAYTIGLRAINSASSGTASATLTSTPFTTANAPTSLTATPGDTQVLVAFTPPSSNGGSAITNYEYSSDGGTSWAAFSPAVIASPATITGLTNGTAYTIGLRAINAALSGTASATLTSTPLTTSNAPTSLSATPGDSQLLVAFTPPSSNGGSAITNYEYSSDGGTSWAAFSPAVTTSPVTITGLTNGTAYTIGLRAINAASSGASSTTLTSTPFTTSNAPTSLTATPGDTQVVVAFTPPSSNGGSAITNYEYSSDGGTSWAALSPAVIASPATITGLTNGTAYTIGLRAINAASSGASSATLTSTPFTTSNAPTSLTATPGDSQVVVTFTPPSRNGGFAITNYEYTANGGTSWAAFSPAVTTSPATITGLTNGTAYPVELRAVSSAGPGAASTIVTVIPAATPNEPTSLRVTPGNTEAVVAFTAPANSGSHAIDNYEYTTDGGGSWVAFSPAKAKSPVTISGLANGTSYTIEIRAVNAIGAGAASFGVTVTPVFAPTVPAAPTALSGVPGDTQVALGFIPPASNGGSAITNYEYTIDDGASWVAVIPAKTTSPVSVTGLTNGTPYTFKLRAINAVGAGPSTTTSVSATPNIGASRPTAPTSLSAMPEGSQVTLAFTVPVSDGGSDITNYKYTTNGGTNWAAFSPAVTTSPVVVTGLANGSIYTIGLRAVNAIGDGDPSETSVTATPLAVPDAPTNFTATDTTTEAQVNATAGDGQVTFGFVAPADPVGAGITNYQYSLDGGWSWTDFIPAVTTSPATITGLNNGVAYTIELRAINRVGPGPASQSVKATPLAKPNAPTNVSATINGTQVAITFTPPSDVGGAAVTNYEYTFDDGVTWTALNPTAIASPVSITGLIVGENYTARLRGINLAGAGMASHAFAFGLTPIAAFVEQKTDVIEVIASDAQRTLRTSVSSNQQLVQGARRRFTGQVKKTDMINKNGAGGISSGGAGGDGGGTGRTSGGRAGGVSGGGAGRFAEFGSLKDNANFMAFAATDSQIDAHISSGLLSSTGRFSGETSNATGTKRRMFFNNFDVQHDSKTDSTTYTLNSTLLWEWMLSEKTMYGSVLGGERTKSTISGAFAGGQQRWGYNFGGYVVHQIMPGFYADGQLSYHGGSNTLNLANDVVEVNSRYTTHTANFAASLSGVINQPGFEISPELILSYGQTWIGDLNFSGTAYGLVDDTLSLNVDAVSVGNLMFRPESRVPLDGLSVSESLSLLSFGPRLMCEHVRTKNTTSSCGHGGEFGWSRRSADGLGQLTSKISVDRIGASRRTGIQINFERQF